MSRDHPYFSIVIPTRNRASLLERTLESVCAQTFGDFEILVVNDGSSDGTDAVLRRYRDRIVALQGSGEGAPKARNVAIRRATGAYTVFLDDDDLFFPWTLHTLEEAIRRYDFPSLLISRILFFVADDELEAVRPAPLVADRWSDYLDGVSQNYWITLPGTAVRTDVLRRLGGFYERNVLGEEHDVFLRAGLEPGFVFIRYPHMFGYRQHPTTFSRDMKRLYDGTRFLLQREEEGLYPGGPERRAARHLALSRIISYAIRRCFAAGRYRYGYALCVRGAKYMIGAGRSREVCLQLPLLPIRTALSRFPLPSPAQGAR